MASQTVGSYYYDKELPSGLEWRCEVHVYPLEVDQVAERWPERKKRRREWFTADEAARRVREPDLGEIIAAFAASPRKIAA